MLRYAVYGTGGLGRQVAHMAATSPGAGPASVVFVDDDLRSRECNGFAVLDFGELTGAAHRDRTVLVAIADGMERKAVTKRCEAAGLTIGSMCAPTSVQVGPHEIGPGAILNYFTLVSVNVRIGKAFHCNHYSHVSHDSIVGDYVTFAPRVGCNGNVLIEDHAYVGAGATLKQGEPGAPLRIGRGAVIGMGAVVIRDVEPYTVVAGNPARLIRRLDPDPLA
jgi:sugar O-acyltransferase (sialic acid O-acetyltransferase NeuD family)